MKGVAGWLFQRISGIVLLAGLTIHFYFMHFSGKEQTGYTFVIKRLSNPYWIAFDLVFLVSAVYHGFNGMWGIALEYISSESLLKLSRTVIFVLASLLISIGVYIIV